MKKRLIYIIVGMLVALFIVMNGFSRISGESFSDLYPPVHSGKAMTDSNDPGL